jgi:hypothetical protein
LSTIPLFIAVGFLGSRAKEYLLSSIATTAFSSLIANNWPIQFLHKDNMGNNIDIICSTTEQGDRKADG